MQSIISSGDIRLSFLGTNDYDNLDFFRMLQIPDLLSNSFQDLLCNIYN